VLNKSKSLFFKIVALPGLMAFFMLLLGVFYLKIVTPINRTVQLMEEVLAPTATVAASLVRNISKIELNIESFRQAGSKDIIDKIKNLAVDGNKLILDMSRSTAEEKSYKKLLADVKNSYNDYTNIFLSSVVENWNGYQKISSKLLKHTGQNIKIVLTKTIEHAFKENQQTAFADDAGVEAHVLGEVYKEFLLARTSLITFLLTKKQEDYQLVESGAQKIEQELKKIFESSANKTRKQWIKDTIVLVNVFQDEIKELFKLSEDQNILINKVLYDKKNELMKISDSISDQSWFMLNENIKEEKALIYFGNIVYPNVILGSIIIGLLLAFFVSKGIIKKITIAMSIFDKVAQGNLCNKIDFSKDGDEVDQLLFALEKMQNSIRNIIEKVRATAQVLKEKAEILSLVSKETDTRMNEQEIKTIVLTASMSEMAVVITVISANTSDVQKMANKANLEGKAGNDLVKDTVDKIQVLSRGVQDYEQVIASLDKSSSKITEIVSVINKIADQTNLLALNAAIEAARAGDQGRGFAVVADEVRTLANETQLATKEIQGMIDGLQANTKGVIKAMDSNKKQVESSSQQAEKAGKSLELITKEMSAINDKTHEVVRSTTTHSEVFKQMKSSIESVASLTNQTSEGAKKTVSACSEMELSLEQLVSVVESFKTS
jgi:methyl-accepting chemotaxis protein